MNVNIYLEDALGERLNKYCKYAGKPRNAIIREAIKEWIEHHETKQWPNTILNFKGHKEAIPFEASRDELLPPKDNPLA